MPYSLEKKGRCYEVKNIQSGKVHSRCTSKKKADAQIRLLHSLEQSGAGWFGDLIKRITPTKRKEGVLPPQSRDLLAKIGGEPITSLTIVRTPLDAFVKTLLGVVSLGQFSSAVKKSSYDEMYHLTLFINNKYSWEKLEVVRLQEINPIKAKSETLSIPAPTTTTTIQEMVDKTREAMGDSDFSNYDPFQNNCQAFLIATLKAINALTPQAEQFITQDAQKVLQKLPPWTGKISKFITDIGAVSSKIIEGEGKKQKGRGQVFSRRDPELYQRILDLYNNAEAIILTPLNVFNRLPLPEEQLNLVGSIRTQMADFRRRLVRENPSNSTLRQLEREINAFVERHRGTAELLREQVRNIARRNESQEGGFLPFLPFFTEAIRNKYKGDGGSLQSMILQAFAPMMMTGLEGALNPFDTMRKMRRGGMMPNPDDQKDYNPPNHPRRLNKKERKDALGTLNRALAETRRASRFMRNYADNTGNFEETRITPLQNDIQAMIRNLTENPNGRFDLGTIRDLREDADFVIEDVNAPSDPEQDFESKSDGGKIISSSKIKMRKRQQQEIEGGFLPLLLGALAPSLISGLFGNGMHGGAIQQQDGGFLPALALALAPTLLGKLLGNGMHGGAMPTLSAENIKMLISELQKMLPKTIEAVVEEMPQVALRGVREVKKAITGTGVRKGNSWTSALKEWNAKQGGKYQIPKKGSKEYEQVRKLMK